MRSKFTLLGTASLVTRTFRDSGGHYVAAANEFSTIEDFEAKFENFLVEWLQQRKYIPSGPVWDVPTLGSPYPGLIAYDRDRTRVFFGRQLAIGQARDELLAARKRDGGCRRCSSLAPAVPANRRSCAPVCCRCWSNRARSPESTFVAAL